MICFYANTRYAEARTDDNVTSGSVGIPVQFHFSEEWNGTQKIAIFKCGEASVDVALTGLAGDQTVVPADCLEDPGEWLTIGVYGATPDGTVVIPTVWVDVAVTKTGAVPSGVDPSEPTPSWVAQVQEMASDALDNSQAAVQTANDAYTAAISAQDSAQASAQAAAGSAHDADISAQAAAGSAQSAYGYAGQAYNSAQAAAASADHAEQVAAQAGYIEMQIDEDGHLIYIKTYSVEFDFELVDGHLIWEVA